MLSLTPSPSSIPLHSLVEPVLTYTSYVSILRPFLYIPIGDLTLATTSTQIQGAAVVSPTSASQGPLPTTHLLKGHKPVDASSQVPAMKTEAVIPKASGSLQALKNAVATRAKLATSTTTSMTTTNANASSNRSSPLSTSSQLPSTIDITSHNRPHKYVIGNLPVAKELASKLSVLASGNGRGLSRSGSLSTMSSSDVKRHSRFGTLPSLDPVDCVHLYFPSRHEY